MNLAQQEAVNYMHGPCLVLAGAGSGKTRVITHKIGRLIQSGMPANRIAAITFTNKAAAEMRERAKGLIGKAAKDVLVCTFHALGVRMLRQDGSVLGLKPAFSILDTDDVTSILKDAGGTVDAATARQWQWTISGWKSAGLNAAQALAQAADDNERIIATVMGRYEERLTAYQSVDFDDLISLPLKLLQNHEQVRQRWQGLMGHILVDEYQDTNATQYEMLKLLAGGNPASGARFTAVGDDDQSIYGWRGATLDNLKKLPVDFPTLKVITLEQNYRSTSAILRAANNVIGPNPKMPTTKNTKPSAPWHAFRACGPRARKAAPNTKSSATLRCCTGQTTRRSRLRKRCARPIFRTKCRAGRVFLTGLKFATCAPGFACGPTTTTTRLFCAP
jgi:ATP-dependent DNA helicase Rep